MPVAPLFPEDLNAIHDATAPLWEEVRGQSIFVTGGTGFFGMWIVESFCHINRKMGLNAKMMILTRSSERFREKAPHLADDEAVTLLDGDVRTFAFPSGAFRYVIHAGTTSSHPIPPLEMFSTIVDGTRRTLEFALQADTRKFLYVSSGAVYGKQPAELSHIPEEYKGAPDVSQSSAAYGEGKRVGELLCAMMSEGTQLECKVARCFAFVGPHLPLDAHFAIGNFIRDAIGGGPIRISGDGSPFRTYLYASDLAAWLWAILIDGVKCRPYNVGSAVVYSIAEIAHVVKELAGDRADEIGIDVADVKKDNNPPLRYVPSTDRAEKELSLIRSVNISKALKQTFRWHDQ